MNKMEGRHFVETKAEDDQINRQWGELSEKQQQLEEDGIKLVAGSELMQSRKTKKKTSGPSLQEMIEHIWSSHATMKELKKTQWMEC